MQASIKVKNNAIMRIERIDVFRVKSTIDTALYHSVRKIRGSRGLKEN